MGINKTKIILSPIKSGFVLSGIEAMDRPWASGRMDFVEEKNV